MNSHFQLEYDSLTGALNGNSMFRHLSSIKIINCFLLDIDNFSNINHAFGHKTGNYIIKQVVPHLENIKPAGSSLYRFYADKFVILDERHLTQEELFDFTKSLTSYFSQIELMLDEENSFKISFSIGISTAIGLRNISQAEIALEELRSSKRNDFKIFNPTSSFVYNKQKNMYWIHKIQESILNEDIIAYYQPIVDNNSGKITKYECLARLKDDDKIISPHLFMQAAKLTGNLSSVTKYLISHSFEKFSSTSYEFSINITGDDLAQNYLETLFLKHSKKCNIDPSRVVIEILEDIATLDEEFIISQLNSLRKLGFKIAMDDFGIENSNFYKILEFKPDYIKIDGLFIKNITTDINSQIITKAIVDMCKAGNIKIIAEYIHNQDVQDKIIELGIDYSQGFLFGEPKPDIQPDNSTNDC